MKKFTVPLIHKNGKYQKTIYIGEPFRGTPHPIIYQIRWFMMNDQLTIPREIIESLSKLYDLAVKNSVPYEDLCEYALSDESGTSLLQNTEDTAKNKSDTTAVNSICPFKESTSLYALDEEDNLNVTNIHLLDQVEVIKLSLQQFLTEHDGLKNHHYADLLQAILNISDIESDSTTKQRELALQVAPSTDCSRAWYPLNRLNNVERKMRQEERLQIEKFIPLLRSAAFGCLEAEYELAILFDCELNKNETELNSAMELVYNSITPNDSITFVMSGYLYYFTNVTNKQEQYKIAYEQFQLAEKLGSAEACYHMGRMHFIGYGVECNTTLALTYFNLAAKRGNPYASFLLGFYYECGMYGLAVNRYRAIEYYQNSNILSNAETCTRISVCYNEEGNYQLAAFYALVALALFKDEKLLHCNSYPVSQYSLTHLLQQYGNVLSKAGKLIGALDCFDDCVRLMPTTITDDEKMDMLADRADVLTNLGFWDRAIHGYRQAGKVVPNNRRIYSSLSVVHFDRGEFALGVMCVNQAITLSPAYSTAYANKGAHLSFLGQYDEAIENLYKAVSLGSLTSYNHLLRIFTVLGDFAKLKEITDKLKGKISFRLVRYSHLYQKAKLEGFEGKALSYRHKGITSLNNHAESYKDAYYFYKTALHYFNLEVHNTALLLIREAITRNAQMFLAYNLLGNILTKLKRFAEALIAYDKSLEIVGRDLHYILLNKANCLYKFNRHSEAVSLIDKVIHDEHRLIHAHHLKSKICYKRGDMKTAIEANLTLLSQCPTHHKGLKQQVKISLPTDSLINRVA